MSTPTPEILIKSRRDAIQVLKLHKGGQQPVGSIISISSVNSDPGSTRAPYEVKAFRGPKLRLYFDDCSQYGGGEVPPKAEDIQRIIAFAKRSATENLWPMLIHCTAGIARSASAALIVRATLEGDTFKVEEVLNPAWHWPNDEMCRLADEELGLELQAQVEAWKRKYAKHIVAGVPE